MKGMTRAALVLAIAIVSSAHVGSPNVIFEGKAGAYDVRIIVRPPAVVPGLAEVTVRLLRGSATRVTVRPVFWRAGVAGSPSPDEAKRVPGAQETYSAQLWLMARGAYSVYVTVDGAQGSGSASVPVMSVATGRLSMSPGLRVLLGALAAVLVAGLVTIVYVAAGESVVRAGDRMDAAQRRRARLVAAVSLPLFCVILFGGAKWWAAVDADYATRMYRPLPTRATLERSHDGTTLRFAVVDSTGTPARLEPIMPDHGRMMHLFLIDTSMSSFAHLHPTYDDTSTFTTVVPPLPGGRYRLFGEIVTELGQSRTLTAELTLPADSLRSPRTAQHDADDGWVVTASSAQLARTADTLVDGSIIEMVGGNPATLRAGEALQLTFRVRDAAGAPAVLEPYLGMPAHAVIARRDGSVFIHLHSMGTVSMAAQQVFALRDRGDTTAGGRLRFANAEQTSTDDAAHRVHVSPELTFPYEFPRGGDYRMWVQVRRAGRVLTATFDLHVADGRMN